MKDLFHHHKKPSNKQEMVETIQAVWDEVLVEWMRFHLYLHAIPYWDLFVPMHMGLFVLSS